MLRIYCAGEFPETAAWLCQACFRVKLHFRYLERSIYLILYMRLIRLQVHKIGIVSFAACDMSVRLLIRTAYASRPETEGHPSQSIVFEINAWSAGLPQTRRNARDARPTV